MYRGPQDIPKNPQQAYKTKDWVDFADFLGIATIPNQKTFPSFEEAKDFARSLYDNVEKEIEKTLGAVSEELKQKRAQHEKIQAELQNLLNFIKIGNFSKVVSDALIDAEGRSERLKSEMQSLEFQRNSAFKAPPREWIDHRLENLFETLDKNTKASALALKIELDPVPGECVIECGRLVQSRAYYVAYSTINTLALLDETKGANSLRCRTREGPIRTISQIPLEVKIPCYQSLPVHQTLAPNIQELKVLGMTNRDIALRLKIDRKTVAKGLLY